MIQDNHRKVLRDTSLSTQGWGRGKGIGQQYLGSPAWTRQGLVTYRTEELLHGYLLKPAVLLPNLGLQIPELFMQEFTAPWHLLTQRR